MKKNLEGISERNKENLEAIYQLVSCFKPVEGKIILKILKSCQKQISKSLQSTIREFLVAMTPEPNKKVSEEEIQKPVFKEDEEGVRTLMRGSLFHILKYILVEIPQRNRFFYTQIF